MNAIARHIFVAVTKLNIVSGGPVSDFNAPGHYYAEPESAGWNVYRVGRIAPINPQPLGKQHVISFVYKLIEGGRTDFPLDGFVPRSDILRQMRSKATRINIITGNPVLPFSGKGHYFVERIASGFVLYQVMRCVKDECRRVNSTPMRASEMLAFLDLCSKNLAVLKTGPAERTAATKWLKGESYPECYHW